MTITPTKLILLVLAVILVIYGLNELLDAYWGWRDAVQSQLQ